MADGTLRLGRGIHRLRLINQHYWAHLLDKLNGSPHHSIQLLMDDIELLALHLCQLVIVLHIPGILLECLNIDHHDLHGIGHRKLPHLREVFRAVDIVIKRHIVIEATEVRFHHRNGGEHPFTNRHRWHHNNEFTQSVLSVQLKQGTQVDVGFSGSGLHLHRVVDKVVWVIVDNQLL